MVPEAKLEETDVGLVSATAGSEDTQDGTLADARFPEPRATRYRDGLLPG